MRDLCIETNVCIRDDHLEALRRARKNEKSEIAREVLDRLPENAHVSCSERMAFCQDTGYAVFFVEPSQDTHLAGGTIEEAINEDVGRGWDEGYLRPSIVESPIERANTGDNTPAVVYYDLVPGTGWRSPCSSRAPCATT